jgi:hypothetical protein
MEQETRMGRELFAGHRRICPSGGRPHPSVHEHPNATSHVKEVGTGQQIRMGRAAQTETCSPPFEAQRWGVSHLARLTFRVALT